MKKPLVAIVGRPNVGKSHLFNRFLQKRVAIVEDEPGVTRDRLYGQMEWRGRKFILVDTGGIEIKDPDTIQQQVRLQAELAIAEADVLLFVVDGKEGLQPGDLDIAELLRTTNKPVLVAVNKIDNREMEAQVWEFYRLGLPDIIPVSAVHGLNTGELLDAMVSHLPPEAGEEEEGEDLVKVAVVGKPNAGKSSLINSLLGQERVIVSSEPGTTRDAIDTLLERGDRRYLLIDTAGLRRPARIAGPTEKYSVLRALRAIDRCDVALLVIDATQGVTEQDKRIGGYAHETGCGLMLVINKWDLIEKDDRTLFQYEKEVRQQLPFLSYAPIVFVSALTGQRVQRILPLVDLVAEQQRLVIPTAELNRLIEEAVALNPPAARKGKQGKIYYSSQVGVKPPLFLFFVNDPKLIHFSYLRYLENKLREGYSFTGTPLRLQLRRRN
ncbi:MAG TPA: ribosome biogenesis GTPase Der [Firmicutes bacterium]|nr:ribosome biogenesis GTPase Der [Bacillota bacterium]